MNKAYNPFLTPFHVSITARKNVFEIKDVKRRYCLYRAYFRIDEFKAISNVASADTLSLEK